MPRNAAQPGVKPGGCCHTAAALRPVESAIGRFQLTLDHGQAGSYRFVHRFSTINAHHDRYSIRWPQSSSGESSKAGIREDYDILGEEMDKNYAAYREIGPQRFRENPGLYYEDFEVGDTFEHLRVGPSETSTTSG